MRGFGSKKFHPHYLADDVINKFSRVRGVLTFVESRFCGGKVEEAEGYLGGNGVWVHDGRLTHVQVEDEQGPLRFLYRLDNGSSLGGLLIITCSDADWLEELPLLCWVRLVFLLTAVAHVSESPRGF